MAVLIVCSTNGFLELFRSWPVATAKSLSLQYYTLKKIQSYVKNWRAVHRCAVYNSAVDETKLKTMAAKYKCFTINYQYILKILKRNLWNNSLRKMASKRTCVCCYNQGSL